MKAVMIKRYGGPEVLELVEVPRPTPKDDEVLIRVAATSVNPIDWRIRQGEAKSYIKLKFPAILGCDLAGQVEQVGKNVTRLAVGDEVFAMMPQDWGAHAELVPLAEHLVVKKPKGVSMEEAASIPVVAMTALKGIRERGQLKAEQKVLINGASGGVGMAAVQIAKALGASVTAVCAEPSFPTVKNLGADRLIDYKKTDFTMLPEKYDVIFDCVGNQPYGNCKKVLQGPRIHVTTMPRVSTFIRQFLNPLFGIKVYALFTTGEGKQLEYIKSLVEGGKLKTVVDKVFSFTDVVAAQEYSRSGQAKGKIVLKLAA